MVFPGISTCGDKNITLEINQSCLKVFSHAPIAVHLQVQTTECHGCAFVDQGPIEPNTSKYFVIDTSYPLNLQINDNGKYSQITHRFDDFGLYVLKYREHQDLILQVEEEPEYFWLNGLIVLVLLLVLVFLVKAVAFAKKRQWFSRLITRDVAFLELETVETNETQTRQTNNRVAAIDVFRGIAISLMIFVNYGGGQYALFKHAPWNGLTFADVVFPIFIWIMGLSTVLSLRSQLRNSIIRKRIFLKVFVRSVFLICLGIVLNSGKQHSPGLRLPGVLQRIGFTYLIVASVEIIFSKRQNDESDDRPCSKCAEFDNTVIQWTLVASFAALHVALTFLLPVPGCPTGYLGPGGLSNMSNHPNCTGGAAGYIDRIILSPDHLYQRPTSQKIYESHIPYDPEGILGLLTSVVMAFLGSHCGRILLAHRESKSRIWRWILCGVLTGFAAGALCSFSKNDGFIPINKNLWSLSFVLATASIAFLVFTVLYWSVSHASYWSGKPFVYAGKNAIAMYLGHEIMNKQLPWRWTPITETHFEVLAMDVSASVLWIFVSYFMYIYNVFISL